jgi:transcriptional regulator with XRE-family HTH domain
LREVKRKPILAAHSIPAKTKSQITFPGKEHMRKTAALTERNSCTPNHLLDVLMLTLGVTSDAALARALDVPPSTISKIRNRQMPVTSSLLLAAHEATELSIRELRRLLGDTATRYWVGSIGASECRYRKPVFAERLQRKSVVRDITEAMDATME